MVVCTVAGQAGCESAAMGALRGARHYAAGSQALANRDAEGAIRELERAAVLVPRASEIQNHLGLAYWSEGRLDAARTSFERAIELDCDNRAAVLNLDSLLRSASAGKAAK